MNNFHL